MNNDLHILYRINNQDEIIFVNAEYFQFTRANDASEFSTKEFLNCSLWDFITDVTTQKFYRKVVNKVRAGQTINFNFRCDSPNFRRFLGMTITLQEYRDVQFETHIIWTEKRTQPKVFQKEIRLDNNFPMGCSRDNNKIDVYGGNQQVVENTVLNPDSLFELEELPQLSHEMCLPSYQTISVKYQNYLSDKFQIK